MGQYLTFLTVSVAVANSDSYSDSDSDSDSDAVAVAVAVVFVLGYILCCLSCVRYKSARHVPCTINFIRLYAPSFRYYCMQGSTRTT